MSSVSGLGVVVRKYGTIGVEQLTFAAPGPNEVRLKIHACGLCQSDVAVMNGKLTGSNPRALPQVLGHEGAGVIDAVGPGSEPWKVGDRVILTLVMPCNQCPQCLDGRPSLCVNRRKSAPRGRVTGAGGKVVVPMAGLGCMAEYSVVSKNACIPCDAGCPLEKGALISCGVTTGTGAAMNRAKVHAGSCCCVVGCGGVGLSAIQGARICGAKQIIAVDTLPSKLAAAKKFGATHTVNANEVPDVAKAVMGLSGGGVHYGFEAIGKVPTFDQVLASVRPGGMAVMVGVAAPTDFSKLMLMSMLNEKVITGSNMGSSVPSTFVPTLVDLYKKGDLLIDEMISRYYTIENAQASFDDLAAGANLRGVIVMHDLRGMAGNGSSL